MKKKTGKLISLSLAVALAMTAAPVTAMADDDLATKPAAVSAAEKEAASASNDVTTLDADGTEDTEAITTEEALREAVAKGTENIKISGTIELKETLVVNEPVTITSDGDATIKMAEGFDFSSAHDRSVVALTASGAALENVKVDVTKAEEGANPINCVYMATGTKVEGCAFTGAGDTDNPVTRGIVVATGSKDLTIAKNDFKDFFASAYINPGAEGSVSENKTADTLEGWCISDGSQMDFEDNTFSEGNGVDMKVFVEKHEENYDVLKMSKQNPGASVEDFANKITAKDGVLIAKQTGENADIQNAINYIKNHRGAEGGTVRLEEDITVAVWNQIWDTQNLTLDGNDKTLTVGAVESIGNGNYLLYRASGLNAKNMTIKFETNGSAFSMTDGLIEKVTFDGGTYGIVCGATDKGITVKDCVFTENTDHAIYSEESGNGKDNVITGCTFDSPRAVILRSDEVFSNNKVNGALGVTLANTATSTVTENVFAEGSHIELYNCDATIMKNQILCGVGIDAGVPEDNNIDLNYNYWGSNDPASVIVNNGAANITVEYKYDTPEMNTEGVTTAQELQAAVNRAGSIATTITLANDITLDSSISIPSGSNITIEGGQYSLKLNYNAVSCPAPFGSNVTPIPSDVTLTVNNTVIESNAATPNGYGVLTAIDATNTNISMNGCTFKNLYCGAYINPVKTAGNKGTLSITNCKYEDTTYGYSIDEITTGAYLNSVKVTYIDNDAKAEKEVWKNVAYVNGVAAATGTDAIQKAVSQAADEDVITLAPGTYEGIVDFDGKSITVEALYNAYENGVEETDPNKVTEFTGTLSTFNGTNAADFDSDQAIVVKGILFTGAGLKVGDNNYSGVGSLTVENCVMHTGSNKDANDSGYNMYNYFVKVSSLDYDTKVVVKDNLVTGECVMGTSGETEFAVYPIQIWKTDDVTVTGNTVALTGTPNGHQAINISKPADNISVTVEGNKISGVNGGIYVTTWGAEKEEVKGDIVIDNNIIDTVGDSMSGIHIGAESAGQPEMAAAIEASNNQNSQKEAVVPVINAKENADTYHVEIKDRDEVIAVYQLNGAGEITLPDAPFRSGYNFKGWMVDGELKDAGATITVEKSLTIEASWKKKSSSSSSGGGYISSSNSSHGDYTLSDYFASEGDTVTITVEPDKGYVVDTIKVLDWEGNEIDVKKVEDEDNKYTFKMPYGDIDVKVTFKEEGTEEDKEETTETEETTTSETVTFSDVKESDWFYEGVSYVVENGMMNGVGDDQFAPNISLTREMLAVVLYNMEKQPETAAANPFADVKADMWYTDAIVWASANGIVAGYDDSTFGLGDSITREQLATILYRYAQLKGYDVTEKADLTSYTDSASISDYAVEAMQWAKANGIVNGMTETTLAPQGTATRAQVATMLMNFCENVVAKAE